MAEIGDLFAHLGESIQQLFGIVKVAGDRFVTNTQLSFSTMTMTKWIRMVAIVGAYLLIRPYLLKAGVKKQEEAMAKLQEEKEAPLQPNDLRGRVNIPDSDDDNEPEEDTAAATATQWGKSAKRRQRRTMKKLIEAEEKRLEETWDELNDKDIEKYLT